jgi:DNA-binding transcriptional LysR family regulator
MAGPIQMALDQIRNAVENRGSFEAAQSDRHFRVAISDLGQFALLPWLMGYLQEVAPHVTVETVPLIRQGLAEQMSTGDIDIAIGVVKPMGAGFFRQRLQSHGYVCIARKDHPTIRGNITLEQFLHASFVEYYPTGGAYARFAEVADKLFAEAHVSRRVAARLAHMPGMARIIANSDHIAVVPEALARGFTEDPGLQLLQLPFNQPRLHVTQQWHERIHKDPAHIWFREIIARHHGASRAPSLFAVDQSRVDEAGHAA